MKKLSVLVAVVVVAWLGDSVLYPRQKPPPPVGSNPVAAPAPSAKEMVTYENNAFNPSTLTVKAGTTVTFVNNGASPIRIPSGPHPVHTSFSEFDSDTLAPGESYDFTFVNPMTLQYHNHFNPGATGQVIVE